MLVFDVFVLEFVIIVCGFDVSVVDFMLVMMFILMYYCGMIGKVKGWVDVNVEGKFFCVYEGGYFVEYVLFCGMVVIEKLSGIESGCIDGVGIYVDFQMGQDFQFYQVDVVVDVKVVVLLLN